MFNSFLPMLMADAAPARENNMIQTFMLLGFGVLFFYFLLWRPERKRRKAAEALRGAMKKGDRVTAMGIIGTVVRVEATSVVLKMIDGSKIEMLKAAVSDVQPGTEEAATPEVQSTS